MKRILGSCGTQVVIYVINSSCSVEIFFRRAGGQTTPCPTIIRISRTPTHRKSPRIMARPQPTSPSLPPSFPIPTNLTATKTNRKTNKQVHFDYRTDVTIYHSWTPSSLLKHQNFLSLFTLSNVFISSLDLTIVTQSIK